MASKLFVAPSAYPCKSVVALVYLRYVFDEGLENGLHLLAGLPVVHAGVLVQEVVLGLVPLNKELSSEEFSVVESLAEGRSLVLHAGVGLRVENQDRLENAL